MSTPTCTARRRGPRSVLAGAAALLAAAAGTIFWSPAPAFAQPVRVPSLVTTGDRHSCVVIVQAAHCWGDDSRGQLGDGSAGGRSVAATRVDLTPLAGDIPSEIVAGAEHTCVITVTGAVYCWGDNSRGQLGNPAAGGFSARPVRVAGALATGAVTRLAVGGAHTCALATRSRIYCWGSDANGQLGDDAARADRGTPVPVSAASPSSLRGRSVADLVAGRRNTCALDIAGVAHCWGADDAWQLGNGDAGADGLGDPDQPLPVEVSTGGTLAGRQLAMLDIGAASACAIDTRGAGHCWGDNASGALGDGRMPTDAAEPVTVSLRGAAIGAVAVGDGYACAADASTGELTCWGENGQGQLGDGSAAGADRDVPARVAAPAGGRELLTAAVDATARHSCVLGMGADPARLDFAVACWGDNAAGQLGDGSTADRNRPVLVRGMPVPPQPPTGVAATPLDRSLRASWRPPADVGTGTLMLYVGLALPADVVLGPGVDARRVRLAAAQVHRLAREYARRLATRPAPGSAAPGGSGAATVIRVPGAPGAGGEITMSLCLALAGADGCVLEELTNGARYRVHVFAVTNDGISVPSEAAFGVPAPAGGGGGGELADTGAGGRAWVFTGVGLSLAGAGLLVIARRRTRWVG